MIVVARSPHSLWRKQLAFERVPNPKMGTGCIEIVSHFRGPTGYVQLNVPASGGSRHIPAHRLSYMSKHGEDSIPLGWEVHHLCGNRACVRRSHLEALHPTVHKSMTTAERGQERRDEARRYWLMTGCSGAALGRKFGVTTKCGREWVRKWIAEAPSEIQAMPLAA
ncbi:HNH endonuclease signature motif containing protein [Novosphingobium sp. JCM 18896]|uniref:HNH endonuclease signature motif containing protein n=1 Tax=Novosphingobium sp. JCM 18896 TaxID=2989731 RepID=UPI0039B4CFED